MMLKFIFKIFTNARRPFGIKSTGKKIKARRRASKGLLLVVEEESNSSGIQT